MFQERNPNIPIHKLLYLLYPYNTILSRDHIKNVEGVLNNLNIETNPQWRIALSNIEVKRGQAVVNMNINGEESQFGVPCGEKTSKTQRKGFVKTEYQTQLLNELLLSHSVGDFCIVGKF